MTLLRKKADTVDRELAQVLLEALARAETVEIAYNEGRTEVEKLRNELTYQQTRNTRLENRIEKLTNGIPPSNLRLLIEAERKYLGPEHFDEPMEKYELRKILRQIREDAGCPGSV